MICLHCLTEVPADLPPVEGLGLDHARRRREYFNTGVNSPEPQAIPAEHGCPGFPLWNPTAVLTEPLTSLVPCSRGCGRPLAHHCNTCGTCACDGTG